MPLTVDRVLVTLDCSDKSIEAAEYAVAVADRYDADLHLLYIINRLYRSEFESGNVRPTTHAEEQQAITEQIVTRLPDSVNLTQSTAVGYSTERLRQTPGTAALDAADELDVDFIVVPREAPSAESGTDIGKAALYVIEYASQPVLSV